MKTHKNNIIRSAILFGIIVLALALRLDGIGYRMYEDETIQIFQTLSVGRLNFREINNGIFPILLFLFYGVVYAGGYLLGMFQSVQDFLSLYYHNMYSIFLIGRLAESAMGAASVFMLYLLGKKMWARSVGLTAAFLMAVSYVDVNVSQIARGQAFATFFIIASFYFTYRVFERGLIWDYILAALFGGLAGSIRIMSLYLLLPLAVAHFARIKNGEKSKNRVISFSSLALGAFCMFAVFSLTNPQNWYQPHRLLDHVLSVLGLFRAAPQEIAYIGSYRIAPLYYITSGLPQAYGWVILTVTACGILNSIIRLKDRRNWMVLAGLVPYIVVLSRGSIASFRYLFPISFLLLLLGSVFVVEILGRIKAGNRPNSMVLITVVVILVGIQSFSYVLQNNRLRTSPRTQLAAADWIFDNIPHGAIVAADSMGGSGPDLRRFPVVDYWIYNLSQEELKRLYDERISGDPGGSKVLKYFMENPPYPKYYLFNLGTRDIIDVDALKNARVEYVVLSSLVKKRVSEDLVKERHPDTYQSRQRLYTWLNDDGNLIKSFSSSDGLVGPTIDIYRMDYPVSGK